MLVAEIWQLEHRLIVYFCGHHDIKLLEGINVLCDCLFGTLIDEMTTHTKLLLLIPRVHFKQVCTDNLPSGLANIILQLWATTEEGMYAVELLLYRRVGVFRLLRKNASVITSETKKLLPLSSSVIVASSMMVNCDMLGRTRFFSISEIVAPEPKAQMWVDSRNFCPWDPHSL